MALLKSFWVLGMWHRGRVGYWRLFWGTLIRRPRQFPQAMELAIIGYHFRFDRTLKTMAFLSSLTTGDPHKGNQGGKN